MNTLIDETIDAFTLDFNDSVLDFHAQFNKFNISRNTVFTSPNVAKKIIDLLPQKVWENPDMKFLDISTKSGVFLNEIFKKLYEGLKNKIPNTHDRINHILKNQIFAIAMDEKTAIFSRKTLYGSMYANNYNSWCNDFNVYNSEGNIVWQKNGNTLLTLIEDIKIEDIKNTTSEEINGIFYDFFTDEVKARILYKLEKG